jgi:hypothetical protein
MGTVFPVNGTGKSNTGPVPDARRPAVIRDGIAKHGDWERMQAQALAGRSQHLPFIVVFERRHGLRLSAGWSKGVQIVIT